MSQIHQAFTAATIGAILDLTGNVGGPVGPDGAGNINIVGANPITVTGNPVTNTLTISVGGTIASSYPTDAGIAIPAAGVLNILTQFATLGCGSSVYFSAPGPANTVQLNVTDINHNTLIGELAGNLTLNSSDCVALGWRAGHDLTTGMSNVLIGVSAGFHITGGSGNVAIGYEALASFTTAAAGRGSNTIVGSNSTGVLTTGAFNSSFGVLTAPFLTTGSYNNFIGYHSGSNYLGAESSNILINNVGILGESNVIRIGTQGAADQQQNTCFIAGISGVNVGSIASVVSIATGSGQLGTTTIQSAGGTITVTPGANTIDLSVAAGSGSLLWTREVGAAVPMVNGHGYINTNVGLTTFTLPALAAVGTQLAIMGESAAFWTIAQNGGQNIQFGNVSTTPGGGGSLTATNAFDSIWLICRVANTTWQVMSATGNIAII